MRRALRLAEEGGLAVSPPIFGWSVDRLGTYIPGFVVVTVLFFGYAAVRKGAESLAKLLG